MQIIEETRIPILGVCLGMQAIAVRSGAKVSSVSISRTRKRNADLTSAQFKIVNTPDLKHGHVIPVMHNGTSLFDSLAQDKGSLEKSSNSSADCPSLGQVDVVAYNSLTVSREGESHRFPEKAAADRMDRLPSRQATSHCVARGISW
jgi:para-aminobenzoate synthetase